MALIQVDFFSDSLRRTVNFQALLPNDLPKLMREDNIHYERPMKTLYLLHGYSGNNKDWLLNSPVQELSVKYNMAIIFPAGENSFYVDAKSTGRAYGTFIGEELTAYVQNLFHLSPKREDTFIGGLSMGGFGAIQNGLKYNNTFSKIIALSSALIIHQIKNKKEDFKNEIADYYYYHLIFGNLDELEGSDKNPETLIKGLKMAGRNIPEIFMACGREDFLIEENRSFVKFLEKEEVRATYIEDTGVHDWAFWTRYLEPAIKWLLESENK
ncbi:alpha/beta hydrolase [Anaerocolumna jejuensis]|uniref:alpha/beta hydrolase n=1 Tax=Anaerocolumna jejuensis TaxID=259063 RepID=UPI003F7BC2B1